MILTERQRDLIALAIAYKMIPNDPDLDVNQLIDNYKRVREIVRKLEESYDESRDTGEDSVHQGTSSTE